MAAAEAVYRGGASPWQREKPLEPLLNAGPGAASTQRSAVGRGDGEGRGQRPPAGGREPRGAGGTSSRTFLWPGLRSEPGAPTRTALFKHQKTPSTPRPVVLAPHPPAPSTSRPLSNRCGVGGLLGSPQTPSPLFPPLANNTRKAEAAGVGPRAIVEDRPADAHPPLCARGKGTQLPPRSPQAPHTRPEQATPGSRDGGPVTGAGAAENAAGLPRPPPRSAPADMAESWLRLPGAGPVEEAGPEGGLEESDALDDSLTSLQWLQEFSILNAKAPALPPGGTDPHGYHQVPGSAAPGSPLAADPACLGQPHTPGKPTASCTPRSAPPGLQAPPPDDVDYATNPHVKPPYSYATLICMAMQASKATKITLSAIYKWITDNFCYFRHADPTWQNSIRHNLSLNKCFIKVPREKDEPGKGGFWRIDPQYAERLLSGAFKKRRLPPVHIHPAFARQASQEPGAAPWAAPLAVNTEAQQLLREFEEATGEAGWGAGEGRLGHKRKQPLPKRVAKVPRAPSTLLLTQEEQGELEPLKGSFDWEAIFEAGTLGGELGTLEALELSPPLSPASHGDVDLTVHGRHIDCPTPWGPPAEQAANSLDFDETFLATSFLQHPWDESGSGCLPPEPLFEAGDATLAADLQDWASVGAFL